VRRDGVRDQRTAWLTGGAPTTSEINADADAQPKPDLAAAGGPAQFFAVSEGLTSECGFESAATFLGAVDSDCSNLPAICRLSRRQQKARPREPGSLLDSVVGRVRLELTTNGLKVQPSARFTALNEVRET